VSGVTSFWFPLFTFCDREEVILQLQNQRRQCEDDFLSKIALKEKEIEELRQKKVSFSAVIQHSNNKADELEVENSQLQAIVKELEAKCETNQVYFNNQLEKVRIEQLFFLLQINYLFFFVSFFRFRLMMIFMRN
jgi:FtsZ-binding cell division protein ZapB